MPGRVRMAWTAAWLLALAGPGLYLLWPGDATWWVGLLMLVPLAGLAARRGGGSEPYGGGAGGVYAPPGDGGM